MISSDNKGIAELLFEEHMNGKNVLPGQNQGKFIAAFAQLPEGDSSANILGAFCYDGSECSKSSTCPKGTPHCHGKGPGKDHFESSYIIGKRQYESAYQLFEEAKSKPSLNGPIDFRHMFVDMKLVSIEPEYTHTGKREQTCLPAIGFSLAAGTTDGPGGWFEQGINGSDSNPFWRKVIGFIRAPTPEQKQCQSPKPILFDVSMERPYLWVPDTLPLQLVRIGSLFIAAYPVEITTMAGRRMKERLVQTLMKGGIVDPQVIILPLSNAYSEYVTTYEEYIVQRYEGASTLWGPHTLSAYIQEMDKLAIALLSGTNVPVGPLPKDLSKDQISLNPDVIVDAHPLNTPWGSVYLEPFETYNRGDKVVVEFWSGHLKNDFMTGKSFFTIERREENGEWKVVKSDASMDTFMQWKRVNVILPYSRVVITWEIDKNEETGIYRIRHFGYAKPNPVSKDLQYYEGTTKEFIIQ